MHAAEPRNVRLLRGGADLRAEANAAGNLILPFFPPVR